MNDDRTDVSLLCVSLQSATEAEEYVVLLADTRLLDLPLEALSILQDNSLCSVSRDFSLQLLHSRLPAHPGKVTGTHTQVVSFDKKGTTLS